MGLIEEVINRKKRGMTDSEIYNEMQEQGISPKAISNAIGQADIKNAISQSAPETEMQPTLEIPENYSPQTSEDYSQQEYASQDYYPEAGYQDYNQPQNADANTIMEIAEQVFLEKSRELEKNAQNSREFEALAQAKLDQLQERIKRIETIMDKLQIAILEKVGSYGSNLNSIKKEMEMMQETFKKVAHSKSNHSTSKKK